MGARTDASFLADTSMGEADNSMGTGLMNTPGMGASLSYNVHGTPSVQDDGWGASNVLDGAVPVFRSVLWHKRALQGIRIRLYDLAYVSASRFWKDSLTEM